MTHDLLLAGYVLIAVFTLILGIGLGIWWEARRGYGRFAAHRRTQEADEDDGKDWCE